MPNFCVKCGAPLNTGPFCVKCGADIRNVGTPSQPPSPSLLAQTPPAHPTPSTTPPVPARQGMSAMAKLGIAAVAIIFVGAAAGAVGVYYVAHRVSQKIHQTANGILGSSSDSISSPGATGAGSTDSGYTGSGTASGNMGDVCRFLSKEDVGSAIGVEIVRTHSEDNGCSYIAKGTQADMTAKHITAMMAARGADKNTQQMIQTFAGGMGKMFESEKPESNQDASGEVPVFNFSVDPHAAEEQMRLNAKGLARLGDTQGLPGIGDQAFVSADGMIMARKGKSLIRIMYITCPCGTDAVMPLAKKIADAL